jgi:neutral ceramidase
MTGRILLVCAGLCAACARVGPPVVLPAAASRPPVAPPADRGFAAGFGRADITPPPGLGLAGYGPEGKRATGYRSRLYVRALLLEDARGERVAFVVADLPFVSAMVQRWAARLIDPQIGVGADRLLLSATHTHAGPGHAEDGRLHNALASQVPGYDSAFTAQLAAAVARAVSDAAARLQPARVASGVTAVWGLTRNRSLAAYDRNGDRGSEAPAGLDSASAAVDPTLTMLRVDVRRSGDSVFRPAAALSVFAMHGTGNPSENDLYDGDIHALVERAVERHIDSLAPPGPGQRSVHLFANGAEGDVSPAWVPQTRCEPPTLHPIHLHGGSRAPSAWEWRSAPAAARARCLAASRASVAAIGEALGQRAIALFDSLEPGRVGSDPLVARAFRALPLTGPNAAAGLCAEPLAGASTVAGAEDGPTRYRGWRWLGFVPSAFREGGRAALASPTGCQAEKRAAVPGLVRALFVGPHSLPETAQLAVVRVGGLVFAAVPAEVTTAGGRQLADSVRLAAARAGAPADAVAVLGLTNGFMQYVATGAEYRLQHYEGGSTIYGPATASVLARELAALTSEMGGPVPTSPPAALAPITIYPGPPRRLMSRPGSAPGSIERTWLKLACGRDMIVAEWRDAPPGDVLPTDAFLLQFERLTDSADRGDTVALDDGPDVEVRALEKTGDRLWRWQVKWRVPTPGRYRLVLKERDRVPELVGQACSVGPGSGP